MVTIFIYAEGYHDPPLVILIVVTELDLCHHDLDGMSNNVIININIVAFDYNVCFDKNIIVFSVYNDNNVDYFICYII